MLAIDLVTLGTGAYENFLLKNVFTEGGQTQLEYWIIKDGIDNSVFLAKQATQSIQDFQRTTNLANMFKNAIIGLGVQYTFALQNSGYPIDYSALGGDSMNVVVFAPQSKIDITEQAIGAKLLTGTFSGELAKMAIASLPVDAVTLGAAVPITAGASLLLAGSVLLSTVTDAWYQSQMADPSQNYTEYVTVQSPPDLITTLPKSEASTLIYDEYMVQALMNASIESSARAYGALEANSSYYAYRQESLAEQYAQNASVYWQNVINGLSMLLGQINSTGNFTETAFSKGQSEHVLQGLPENVSAILQAMDLLNYVNVASLKSLTYSPINVTAITSVPNLPASIAGDDELALSQIPFAITFSESGLRSGTSWTVTLNGINKTSTADTITFKVTNGTYNYVVYSPSGHTTSLDTGAVAVSGSDQNISLSMIGGASQMQPLEITVSVVAVIIVVVTSVFLFLRKKQRETNAGKKRKT